MQTSGECFFNLYPGCIDDMSTFANVSFWNGESLASGFARGGTWQTTSNAIYSNTIFGPFGTELNAPRPNSRMFGRFANQGRTDITATNHSGLSTNLDFRALQEIDTTVTSSNTLNWHLDIDSGSNIYFVNWLPGRPLSFGTHRFTNLFNSNAVSQVTISY